MRFQLAPADAPARVEEMTTYDEKLGRYFRSVHPEGAPCHVLTWEPGEPAERVDVPPVFHSHAQAQTYARMAVLVGATMGGYVHVAHHGFGAAA